MREISYKRTEASMFIQKNFRIYRFSQKLHQLAVVARLFRSRNTAAIFIQKYVRGLIVRKDLWFMKRRSKRNLLIRWRYKAK
mmetsp:Transcript_14165/g.2268  ORF Transcript_14165/g.2268 Transcript_14165/m.2268 type:complete len:82 (+) Transcript_14165:344-589(+)